MKRLRKLQVSQPKIINLQTRGFFLRNLQNEKLNELSSMTELEKIISKKFQKQTSVQEFHKILDKNGLETLEDWKKVTKEEKMKYPDGLKHLLDEACGSENLVEWNELSEEKKMLKVNDFISFCAENKSKVTQKFGDEGFIFQYQKRTIPEEVMVKHICSNFLNFSCGVRLQQKWNLLTIIGGSGVGKSRLSYEVWNILKDYVQNHEALCIKWLNDDKEIFSKFKERILGSNLIEVFAKEANGDSLKSNDTLEFHLGCSLASCLFKNNQNEREIVSISYIKKLASDKGKAAEFSNIDLIFKCLSKLHGGSPLTVIWRLDEIQNVDRGKGFSKHESKVYQYISKLMGLTLNFTSGNFIIPIISGTTNATIKGDLPGSTFKIISVPLFISDFNVDDALRMVKEKILVEETNELKKLIEALGPIPRLIQFMVDYLIEVKGKYNIPEIYNYMCNQVVELYRIDSWTDQKFNATVMLSILEKWNPQEYLTISPKIEEFIQDGVLFTTKTGHLFLPIVFVKTLLKSFRGFNYDQLIQYLDRGIYKSFEHVDLETFPVWFYAFKVFLYFQLGIKSVTIEKLFHGAFMNEEIKLVELSFNSPMKVYYSRSSTVTDLTSVKLKYPALKVLDLSNENAALHIGSNDPYRDATLIFPDCSTIVDLEMKYSQGGRINFDSETPNSFKSEQEKAGNSPCTSNTRYFLFITNSKMTEKVDKLQIVNQNSMFINEERWIDAFSPLFEGIKQLK